MKLKGRKKAWKKGKDGQEENVTFLSLIESKTIVNVVATLSCS
jgi:hypothetical protein